VLLLSVGFVAGFATSRWLDKAVIRQALDEAAVARESHHEAQQEAEALAQHRDELEEELWGTLADQPSSTEKPGAAKELSGKVVGVADGDTITVLDETKTPHRIRLLGIDAPEKNQAFGTRAKQALSEKVFGKEVVVRWAKKDQYGRVLGDVHLDGRWMNKEMIADGFAWHYKHYDHRPELAKAEEEARKAKSGLWVDKNPEAPWDYRARMRKPRPPPSNRPDEGKESAATHWLNTATGVRHNAGCQWFKSTKQGRLCRPDEGRPCGKCGG
jgi:endonuclease YncB( thermonuclease family)